MFGFGFVEHWAADNTLGAAGPWNVFKRKCPQADLACEVALEPKMLPPPPLHTPHPPPPPPAGL